MRGALCCLLLALLGLLAACQTSLVQGLSEREANELVLLLGDEGIVAEKQSQRGGGFSVLVASDLSQSALQILSEAHLPRPQRLLRPPSSLLPSPAAEQEQRLAEKVFSLEQSLAAVPNVLVVRVEVATEPWPSKTPLRSAAVLYHYRDENPFVEDTLRGFLAASLGLAETGKVTVLAIKEPSRKARESTSYVGTLGVLPSYEPRLRWLLASLGCLLVGLLCALGFVWLRRRKPEA